MPLTIVNKCDICGNLVDVMPDKILKEQSHVHNAEFVVTHLGRKKYIHSKCWHEMIEEQKKHEKDLA